MKVPSDALELNCYYTWRGEDGIIRTKVKPGAEVTLPDAQENSIAVNSFYEGSKYPLLVDSRGIKSISREARNQFSIKGRKTNVTCFAIIIDSPLSRVIGNFFMGINKPEIPMCLFDDEEEALSWLLKLNEELLCSTEEE